MAKKDIVIYPAIFDPEPESHAINVTFPDVPEAITYGRNETDAAFYANEVLGLTLVDRKRKLPKVTPINEIPLKDGQYVVMIAVDLKKAKKTIR
jgi:hypothetical protein